MWYREPSPVPYVYDDEDRITEYYQGNQAAYYTYDSRGNILSRTEYSYTTSNHLYSPTKTATFEYSSSGWTDRLVKVNNTPLTYDEAGNVLTYGNRSFSWNSGRNLASITEGTDTYSYTYDENGIRTSKTYEGVTTYYTTENGVITSQNELE